MSAGAGGGDSAARESLPGTCHRLGDCLAVARVARFSVAWLAGGIRPALRRPPASLRSPMLLSPASLWSLGAGDGRRGSRRLRGDAGDGGASSVAENWSGGGQGGDPVPRWYMWRPCSGWLALRCVGALVTPRPVTASLGDSRILWGHAAPLWGHGASPEGLAGCSGRREGGTQTHPFGVSVPSL